MPAKPTWKAIDGEDGKMYSKKLAGLRWYARLNTIGEIEVSYQIETPVQNDDFELALCIEMLDSGVWVPCDLAFSTFAFRKGSYPKNDPTFDSEAPALKQGHARLFERVIKERFPQFSYQGISGIWAIVLPTLKHCETYDSMVKKIKKASDATPLSLKKSLKLMAPEMNVMTTATESTSLGSWTRDDANLLIEQLVALQGRVEWAPFSASFENECKAFSRWISRGCVSPFPPPNKLVKINCWEAVLTAAYNARLVSAEHLGGTSSTSQFIMDGVFKLITRFVRGSIVISKSKKKKKKSAITDGTDAPQPTGCENLIRPGDIVVCRRRPVAGGAWEIGHVGVALDSNLSDWKSIPTLSLYNGTETGTLPLKRFIINEPETTLEVITYSRL